MLRNGLINPWVTLHLPSDGVFIVAHRDGLIWLQFYKLWAALLNYVRLHKSRLLNLENLITTLVLNSLFPSLHTALRPDKTYLLASR